MRTEELCPGDIYMYTQGIGPWPCMAIYVQSHEEKHQWVMYLDVRHTAEGYEPYHTIRIIGQIE